MAILPKPVGVEEDAGTEKFVDAIERRRDERGLATPWSIAELGLDDEDYARLGVWAGRLGGRTVREWTKDDWSWAAPPVSPRRPRRACLGLLLLTLAAEAARREATEATLWRHVQHSPDGKPRFRADADLFVQGQPNEDFKAALRAAVEVFGLRHLMDDVDTNRRYYLTVFLQFGFGIRDAEHRLPAWLAGQALPVSVERLAARGGRLDSESFATLWRDLRHGRGGLLPAEALRKRLRASPWVLPTWEETLIGLVGRSLPSSASAGRAAPSGGLETILDAPRLVWPGGGTPHFACKIVGLATAPPPGRESTLRVAGRVVARIGRGEAGFESDRESVDIPGFPSIAAVELRDEESGASEDRSFDCFDPREPALLFDLRSGRPIASGTRPETPGRYALVFAEDLMLSPEPVEWRAVRCGPMRLRVAALAGDARGARLTLGGVTVWEARSPSDGPSAPSWAWATLEVAGKAAALSSLPMGQSYDVAIRHPAGVSVAFVRLGMEPLEPRPKAPGLTHVGPIASTVSSLARESRWLIGLEHEGASARIAREFRPARHGGAIFRGETWEVLDPANALDAGDARRSPVIIAPPPAWDGQIVRERLETWAVMEGEDRVDVPGSNPRIIPRLSGLGGRLTVRLGPFNAVPATPPDGGPKRLDALILADRVVDRGIVRGVLPDEADDPHAWRIELADEVEIDERYEVHWWDRSGEVHHLRPSAWSVGESARHDWWSVGRPHVATEPRALLVTYDDRRLGAWWAPDWAAGLAEVASARDPGLIADLVRWFKLPALEERSLPEARRLAERWPVEVLRSWSSDEAPVGWHFVVREAFRDWRPSPDQAEGLSIAFGASGPIPEVATSLRLMKICPVLMGRYLRARADQATPGDMRVLRRMIREEVEGELKFEVCDYVGTEETVHDGVERMTRLAPAFLKTLNAGGVAAVLDRPADGEFDQRRNLDLAVSEYVACRLLLTLDILRSLEAGELSYWKGGRCGTS